MAKPHIHYEAAFEDFVRTQGWPFVPVDERKKTALAGARLKSFDFLVYPPEGPSWLVDVKGRKFPYELGTGRRYWENWVPQTDLRDLPKWESAFGPGFEPVFVFAYWLLAGIPPNFKATIHRFRGAEYAFLRITPTVYAEYSRRRSSRWETVSLPQKRFRALVRPLV